MSITQHRTARYNISKWVYKDLKIKYIACKRIALFSIKFLKNNSEIYFYNIDFSTRLFINITKN